MAAEAFEPPPAEGFSGRAVAGLVLSLLLVPVIGLVLSVRALGETRDGRRRGRGLAALGTVLGLVNLAVWFVFVVMPLLE